MDCSNTIACLVTNLLFGICELNVFDMLLVQNNLNSCIFCCIFSMILTNVKFVSIRIICLKEL
jgi:hypothetical protein